MSLPPCGFNGKIRNNLDAHKRWLDKKMTKHLQKKIYCQLVIRRKEEKEEEKEKE